MNTDKPIIYKPEMVRAILREIENPGTGKTQTRRVIKPPVKNREIVFLPGLWPFTENKWFGENPPKDDPSNYGIENFIDYDPLLLTEFICPHGKVGDYLWVRENWLKCLDTGNCEGYAQDPETHFLKQNKTIKTVPSIHMPRWASRITLEIMDIRVERVQDISAKDARAEGIESYKNLLYKFYGPGTPHSVKNPIESFKSLWDSINADRGYGWAANPWVWAITFKPHLANIDDFLKERAA